MILFFLTDHAFQMCPYNFSLIRWLLENEMLEYVNYPNGAVVGCPRDFYSHEMNSFFSL